MRHGLNVLNQVEVPVCSRPRAATILGYPRHGLNPSISQGREDFLNDLPLRALVDIPESSCSLNIRHIRLGLLRLGC